MMETKMCEPIDVLKLISLYTQVEEYRELKEFVDACYYDNEITLSVDDVHGNDISICVRYIQVEDIVDVLEKRMEGIESSLNVLGYTMENEPKEFKYHVNVLKGENDGKE